MKLYLISQNINNDYDTFSDAVVAARSAKVAQTIHPSSGKIPKKRYGLYESWVNDPNQVTVEYLGEAAPGIKEGVILASFHAG